LALLEVVGAGRGAGGWAGESDRRARGGSVEAIEVEDAGEVGRERSVGADQVVVGAELEQMIATGPGERVDPFVVRLVEQRGEVDVAAKVGDASDIDSGTDRVVGNLDEVLRRVLKMKFVEQIRGEDVGVLAEITEVLQAVEAVVADVAVDAAGIERWIGVDVVAVEEAEGERVGRVDGVIDAKRSGGLCRRLVGGGRTVDGRDVTAHDGAEVEDGVDVGRVAEVVGDVCVETEVFGGSEEKSFVAVDGAAECGAEIVLHEDRLGDEVIGRVKGLVAGEVEEVSVQVVGAGLGDDVDEAAAGIAVLGQELVGHHLELRDGVLRERLAHGAIELAVVFNAIDHDVVGARTLAVYAEAAALSAGRLWRDAGNGKREVSKVAAVGGKVFDLLRGDGLAGRGAVGIDDGDLAGDFNALLRAADLKCQGQRSRLRDGERDAGFDEVVEAVPGNGEGVVADGDVSEAVAAFGVADAGAGDVGGVVDQAELGARHEGSAGVVDIDFKACSV